MTKAEIIAKCGLYMDDTSELSSQELSDLFDKKYRHICSMRPWEFTKKEHTATVSGTSTTLPSDFLYLTNNNDFNEHWNEARKPVVFVGSNYAPYFVVSWSERRQYRNRNGFAYLDIPNNNLVFTTSVNDSVEFDYHASVADLALDESPIFPEEFHPMIYHAMAVDEFMIQQYEKARSYADENKAQYDDYYARMSYWNSKLVQL